MSISKINMKVIDTVREVSRSGKAICLTQEIAGDVFWKILYALQKKNKQLFAAGRSGFTFNTDRDLTRMPGYEEQVWGLWIFPTQAEAAEKLAQMRTEGWYCRTVSWEE